MKSIHLIISVLINASLFGQSDAVYIDPITIQPDGTSKRFNTVDRLHHSEDVVTGLRINFWDSSFTKIRSTSIIANRRLNGECNFFNEQGFLIEKGNYKDDLKDGDFFYWSNKGIFIRKEKWKMGYLIHSK